MYRRFTPHFSHTLAFRRANCVRVRSGVQSPHLGGQASRVVGPVHMGGLSHGEPRIGYVEHCNPREGSRGALYLSGGLKNGSGTSEDVTLSSGETAIVSRKSLASPSARVAPHIYVRGENWIEL